MVKAAIVLFLVCAAAPGLIAAPADGEDQAALIAVVRDMCPLEVAMLGEGNTHGDGHTEAFKVALVERLVEECGFDSVYFEASHYEFIGFARRLRMGQTVTGEQILAAVGGLWRFDREFQPLVPFLLAKAQAGKLSLGGTDDQLGQAGQEYANVGLVEELSALLPEERRKGCALALHRRIYSDYEKAAPYAEADRSAIATCLEEMGRAGGGGDAAMREEQREMISAAGRWIGRDFLPGAEGFSKRDASMFQDLEWLRRQQPRRRKAIVWAASVHIARGRSAPGPADGKEDTFGAYVHRAYGGRAFSLGFSALGGAYRQGRSEVHDVPAAPADSIEAQAMRGGGADAVYVGAARLAAFGTAPCAALRHTYQTLAWSHFLDGVVVFREERPPGSMR